jgi:hypothetical protein
MAAFRRLENEQGEQIDNSAMSEQSVQSVPAGILKRNNSKNASSFGQPESTSG